MSTVPKHTRRWFWFGGAQFSLRTILCAVAVAAVGLQWLILVAMGLPEPAVALLWLCGLPLVVLVVAWRDCSIPHKVRLAVYFLGLWTGVSAWATLAVMPFFGPQSDPQYDGPNRGILFLCCVAFSPVAVLATLGFYRESKISYLDHFEVDQRS
jgi:hypothetical protein